VKASGDSVRLVRADVLACLEPVEVIEADRGALIASARGEVTAPRMSFDFRSARGDAHVMGAHINGEARWRVKLGTGFYRRVARTVEYYDRAEALEAAGLSE
jgi:hypothetical protein